MNNTPKTVYLIAGPTASGKTRVAIELAKRLNTSILSADSRQCYKEMNIGTACPSLEELEEVKHYFIRECSVTQNISAADYETIALNYLEEIFKEKDTAVVCGGTGLYIKALTEGLDEMPEVSAAIEEEVNACYLDKGVEWLQQRVEEEDLEFFKQGEIQNPARLIRALVFKRSTGKSIIHFRTGNKKKRAFKTVKIALNVPREALYERINHRVEEMMKAGLLEEVKNLFHLKHLKNLQTVGYTELFDFLEGKCSLEEAVEKIKQHTRNYAKRQITWFKKDKEFVWVDVGTNSLEQILASASHT
jgi:tRNA dimethylallyltransferase